MKRKEVKHTLKKHIKIVDTGCWEWQRSVTSSGYGQLHIGGKNRSVHRLSFLLFNGKISKGLLVRHTCHNKKCCNPQHLILGTDKDNYHDSYETHREASKRQRYTWVVGDKSFPTQRTAIKETGLSSHVLTKYSVKGVFNIHKYREGCKKGNCIPKV